MNAKELIQHIGQNNWNNDKRIPFQITFTKKEWDDLKQMVEEYER